MASQKHKKSKFRRLIGWLHLWLGLISGIVVVIVSITGCLFVFQKEISESVYRSEMFVQPQSTATLPVSQLNAIAQKALGKDKPVEYITTYKNPSRAWEFMAYKSNDTALTYFGAIEYYQSVFINPYTGAVTGIKDYKYDFFAVVKYIHWSLLLNTKYGQPIVGWATFIFVILLITGLILWWPKKWNRATKQQSFGIKWGAKIKRLNYDLHNVLGFYSLLIAMILGLTGMIFSFRWFVAFVYVAVAGTTQQPNIPTVTSTQAPVIASPLDMAYQATLAQVQDAKRIGISPAEGKEGTIGCYAYKQEETYYNFDALQFDQYSGKLLNRRNNAEKNRGEKLIAMNYDIHVGAIAGLTGKIIAFVVSLICASLPVTGFYVWWHKKKKTKYKPVNTPAKLLT
jgi:uncharacterized iron-regulated membrane protein